MKKNIIKYICLTLAFVFCFLFTSTANVVHAVETSEVWSSYVVNEVTVTSSDGTVNKTSYSIDAEYSSDGYFRFDYYSYMSSLGFDPLEFVVEQFDWIFWEDMADKVVYDNYSDGGDGYPDANGYIVIPVDSSYSQYRSTLVLELDTNNNATTLIVRNNINNETSTISATFSTVNGQVVTRVPTFYDFDNLFDIPGYLFSGKTDFTSQSGYYVKIGDAPATSITLEFEQFYFLISNNLTDEVVKVYPELIQDGDSFHYEYSVPLGGLCLTDAEFDLISDSITNGGIVQDYLFLRSEYETFSAGFNEMFGIDSKYIIDDFFLGTITKTDIRIDYYDRFLKESDNRLDAITFILTSDDDFDNKIYFYFTDKAFIERELTAVDHWNNFYDNAEILGEDIMKIFSLVLILVVLALTLPLLQPIISILFAFAKFVINVVWWVVTLPFKLIATLFKK